MRMTGKEALIHLSKTCKELELEYGNFKINKKDNEALQTLKEIVQKYDKYKRALDIFKRLLDDDFTYGGFDDGRLLIDGAIDITDDEKELLEELMSDE